ncbi:peptidoglycan-binding protein [Streptomyces albospinus]|uniref:Peptidoglycan-binding protein n=1 Tax=Streptomyces albospinus TaxID=285515 RepID=A0ABQ2UUM7_9ACTN|nr:peptidoglycan-binding domain-containing protein [Streptomyces albospinus]GGU52069.1 peptidoglycan-binding protein [Streptomyces albospinus]
MTASSCPHCSAPVRGDGRPTCLCAAAEAADFDPLRLRPYVSLPDGEGGGPDEDGAGDAAYDGGADGRHRLDDLDDLDGLPGVDAAVHIADRAPDRTALDHVAGGRTAGPSRGSDAAPHAPAPLTPPPISPDTYAPPSLAHHRRGPTSPTLTSSPPPEPPAPHTAAPSGRRRRVLPAVLAVTGAAVAATAILVGTDALPGVGRDRAAPPDGGTVTPTATIPTDDRDTAPAPTAHHSSAASATPHRTAPATTATLHKTAATPRPQAPVQASGSVTDSPGGSSPSAPPTGPIVLREGSSGPEVTELQGRLRQLALYAGPADGRYGTAVRDAVSRYQQTYGVHDDPDGVYGTPTRASLESRTREP